MKTLPILLLLLLLLFGPSAHAEVVAEAVALVQPDEQQEDLQKDYPLEMQNSTEYKCRNYNNRMHEDQIYWHESWNARDQRLTDPCQSATVNAHGTYTSDLKPCTIQFHLIEDDTTTTSSLFLSSACSDSNVMKETNTNHNLELVDYVVKWPDQCVGDFRRCYSISGDEEILLRHFCKSLPKFNLLKGATHVSVNCTADKAEKKQKIKNKDYDDDPYMAHLLVSQRKSQRKSQLEFYVFIIGIMLVTVAFGFCCMYCVYKYGWRPYLATLKRTKSDPELITLVSDGETGTSNQSDRFRSRRP